MFKFIMKGGCVAVSTNGQGPSVQADKIVFYSPWYSVGEKVPYCLPLPHTIRDALLSAHSKISSAGLIASGA